MLVDPWTKTKKIYCLSGR